LGKDPYKLVHNPESGLDVDKLDYLMRDAYHCGKPLMCEPYRIIRGMRWVDDRVCYPVKDVFLIYQVFAARYSMFKQVYSHRVVAVIDFMVTKAIQEFEDNEDYNHISDDCTDDYVWECMRRRYGMCWDWIQNIEERKLLVQSETPTAWKIEKRFNLSMGNRNPLCMLWFYDKQMNRAFHIDPTEYSVLIPKDFMCEEVVTYYFFITE